MYFRPDLAGNSISEQASTQLTSQEEGLSHLTDGLVNSEGRWQFNLDSSQGYLLQSMKEDYVDVGVGRRGDTDLYSELSSNLDDDSDMTESLPWFYHSPQVRALAPYSYANQYRLVEDLGINNLQIYRDSEHTYLFQNQKPYTGWSVTAFDGWYYFDQGLLQASPRLNHQQILRYLQVVDLRDRLSIGNRPYNKIYLNTPSDYLEIIKILPQNYSILLKNTDIFIMTRPAGTRDASLLTQADDFYEIPMEVVQEVETNQGTWLKVYIGYEELGWIEKDESYQDYVLTYYSERELLDRIEAVLWEEISNIQARAGASFVNNETMAQVDVNNQSFFPASTQKIYILGELYHQYKTEELSPDMIVTLTDTDKVPGAGIIQNYPSGSQFTLDELVDLVAYYSDNTAANLLIEVVGGGEVITPIVQQMGLYETSLYGKYYSDGWFVTSPHDAARYFALLDNSQLNGEPYDSDYINKLINPSNHSFLKADLPADLAWNKSGLGGTEQNDVAGFVTPYGRYTLAVFTAEPANYTEIAEHMSQISHRVYETFNEMRSLLWITVE